MFTYKKAPYKFFALGPKFCWAGPTSSWWSNLGPNAKCTSHFGI